MKINNEKLKINNEKSKIKEKFLRNYINDNKNIKATFYIGK